MFLWGTLGRYLKLVAGSKSIKDPVEVRETKEKTDEKGMDIKHALNSILPIQVRSTVPTEKPIKSENATDRDANGQQQYSQDREEKHGPMSDEQYEEALKQLRAMPGVVEHGFQIETEMIDGRRFTLVKESSGKVIKKITESELWTLPQVSEGEKPKGQILRKTA